MSYAAFTVGRLPSSSEIATMLHRSKLRNVGTNTQVGESFQAMVEGAKHDHQAIAKHKETGIKTPNRNPDLTRMTVHQCPPTILCPSLHVPTAPLHFTPPLSPDIHLL